MRPRTTLVLLALAAAAWAAWFLWLRAVPGTEQRREQSGLLLPGFEPGQIDRITFDRRGTKIVLARAGGGWRIEQPVAEPADATQVDGVLDAVRTARTASRVPAGEVRGGDQATGLGTRAASLVTLTGRVAAHSIAVGSVALPGDLRYVQLDGSPALALVDARVAGKLDRELDDFRQHELFTFSPVDIGRFTVRAGTSSLEFARREGEAWWIVAPLTDAADDALIGGIVGQIANLRADHFVDEPKTAREMGLDPPDISVRLYARNGQEAGDLEFGAPAAASGERYGRVPGRPPFRIIPGTLSADLSRDPASFRSKLALDTVPDDVAELTLDRGSASVTIRRTTLPSGVDTWTVVAPAGFALDPPKVDPLLEQLARITGRFADGVTVAAAGLDRPAARAALVGKDPKRLPRTVLDIGGTAGKNDVYARRQGRPTILAIDAATAQAIDPASLRK